MSGTVVGKGFVCFVVVVVLVLMAFGGQNFVFQTERIGILNSGRANTG